MRVSASDWLLVAAHALELAPFRDLWARRAGRAPRPPTAVVGVGMAAAGAGMAARLAAGPRPRGVLLLGSCGAYPESGVSALSLVLPEQVVAVDAALVEGRGAFPEALPQRAVADPELRASLAPYLPELHGGVLATTHAITTDDALARRIAQTTACATENLEALAVALACEAERVPFAALLCCTNDVGSRGRLQWAQNHGRAAERVAEVALAWLAG